VRRQREAAYSKTNPHLQSRIGKNFTFIPKPAVSLRFSQPSAGAEPTEQRAG
jgi:hypothetical protein